MKQTVFTVMSVAAAFSCLVTCTRDTDPGTQEVVLTYHTNGATIGPTPAGLTGRSGESIVLDHGVSFSRDGYSFSGWNTSPDGTGSHHAGGSNFTLTQHQILYASWIPESTLRYTLSYDINQANSGSAPAAVSASQGTSIVVAQGTGFARTGYVFMGWNTQSDGTGTSYAAGANFSLTANTTLYAQWGSPSSSNAINITVGTSVFTATLEGSATGAAFRAMLPLTLDMSELGGVEKYGALPSNPPADASNPGTIQNGDLMLYGSNTLVLFYSTFNTSYSYTRIGRVDHPDGLAAALGAGRVSITFAVRP